MAKTSALAPAGLTAIVVEVVLVRLLLVNKIVIFVATLCERFVNVATPSEAVVVSVPCKVPLPALRAAVTTVELSAVPLAALRRLPNRSWTSTDGCWPKATPAMALAEGCVRMTRLVAPPATSRRMPKLELVDMPTTLAVPLAMSVPLANGVPATGRACMFVHVNLSVTF